MLIEKISPPYLNENVSEEIIILSHYNCHFSTSSAWFHRPFKNADNVMSLPSLELVIWDIGTSSSWLYVFKLDKSEQIIMVNFSVDEFLVIVVEKISGKQINSSFH